MARTPERLPNKVAPPETLDSDLATEVARRIGSLIPGSQQGPVVAQIVSLVEQERFSGPIAHPRHLKAYEETCPGAAERIISMAERNLAHSHSIQNKVIENERRDGQDGRYLGFAALAILMVFALVCALHGDTIAAGLFLGTAALGAVGAIIRGKDGGGDD